MVIKNSTTKIEEKLISEQMVILQAKQTTMDAGAHTFNPSTGEAKTDVSPVYSN